MSVKDTLKKAGKTVAAVAAAATMAMAPEANASEEDKDSFGLKDAIHSIEQAQKPLQEFLNDAIKTIVGYNADLIIQHDIFEKLSVQDAVWGQGDFEIPDVVKGKVLSIMQEPGGLTYIGQFPAGRGTPFWFDVHGQPVKPTAEQTEEFFSKMQNGNGLHLLFDGYGNYTTLDSAPPVRGNVGPSYHFKEVAKSIENAFKLKKGGRE